MNVNCEFVQENVSAFVYSELGTELTAAVHAHIAECEHCSRLVLQATKLNQLARMIPPPKNALPAWELIESRLAAKASKMTVKIDQPSQQSVLPNRAKRDRISWSLVSGMAIAMAASLFLMVKVLFPPSPNQSPIAHLPGDHTTHASLELQSVIEQFRVDPRAALDALRSQFNLSEYSLTQADASLGRPTFVSHIKQNAGLPGKASLISTVVLSFPSCQCAFGECTCGEGGCNCIANVCQRPDGTVYLVFEQCKSQSIDFGDYPIQIVNRGVKQLQQVIIDDIRAVAFDWEAGKVAVVGLRDDDEINSLFASR